MDSKEQKILEKIQKARDYYLKQNYKQAIEIYKWTEEQIKDDPVNLPIIQIELGWSYYNSKDFKNCISYLKKALKSNSLNTRQKFDCLRLIGFSMASSGNKKEAIEYLNKALEHNIPDEEKKYVYFKIGELYFIDGAIKKSKHYFQKIRNYFSWKENAYYRTLIYYSGFIAFYEKHFEEATQYFTEIVNKASDKETKASGYFGLAHILHEKKNFTELVQTCKKILEHDKNFYDQETLGYFFCISFMELKQYTKFTSFYNELHKKYPNGRYRNFYYIFDKTLLEIKSKN